MAHKRYKNCDIVAVRYGTKYCLRVLTATGDLRFNPEVEADSEDEIIEIGKKLIDEREAKTRGGKKATP
jgi:hypothetical protein